MSKFTDLRRRLIEKSLTRMNDEQKDAVLCVEGAVLVLAGAGTGKTTVLVNRVANILKYGNAYHSDYVCREPSSADIEALRAHLESGAPIPFELEPLLSVDSPEPWQMLTITFTNKAADELKTRLCAMLGDTAGNEIWASTFHSACVRILRRDGDRLGFSKHFTIYDSDDSKRVMKQCYELLGLNDKAYPVKSVLSEMSRAKDSLISAEEYEQSAGNDNVKIITAKAYKKYEELLKSSDAMDFDDLIFNTVRLLKENSDVLDYYKRRFRYVMVDEYQDTNHAQYMLTALLSSGTGNLCVVGDDDQSIYKFRGATIENILSFEERFKDAKIIRLERNYRSTDVILKAANGVIANNKGRKGKSLWTEVTDGEPVTLELTDDERDEARYIASEILDRAAAGAKFSDFAVLYRTNAQSNNIERAFIYEGIPYRVIGGHRFYERREIKDLVAYMAVISNHSDSVRLRRIINEPKRGIGDATVNACAQVADTLGLSMFEVIENAADYPVLSRSSQRLAEFAALINELTEASQALKPDEFFNLLTSKTGYIASLAQEKETEEERKANIDELMGNLVRYYEENEDADLTGFLEEIALMTDIDNYNSDSDAAVMMTLHAAKGLEFPCVFISGMEEGLFPGPQSMYFPEELEEERRLAYVGITRAKTKLYITNARSRYTYGSTVFTRPSRFVLEIPEDCTDGNLLTAHDETASPRGIFSSTQRNGSYSGGYSSGTGSGGTGGSRDRTSTYSPPARKRASAEEIAQNAQKRAENRGFTTSEKEKKPSGSSDYKPGDTITHKVFGEGLILNVTKMGNDAMLEVAFPIGTKKLMANFLKK